MTTTKKATKSSWPVLLTVEVEAETDILEEGPFDAVKQALVGELIKVKSGPFENYCYGSIIDVGLDGAAEGRQEDSIVISGK